MSKPKVAFYWLGSCGGCEEAVLDLNEALLDVADAVDIVLWPVAIDAKVHDLEALADGSVDAAFVNGAVRLDEHEEIASLFRRKAKLVLAFGACAHLGGVPGLANFSETEDLLACAYRRSPSTPGPSPAVPQRRSSVHGCDLTLPALTERVRRLDEVIAVDYYIPGCPPQPETLQAAFAGVLQGKLPPRGAVLSPGRNLCRDCPRQKSKPKTLSLEKVRRIHEVEVAPDECFLARGVICLGPATRAGCGERCPRANVPCRGCYGPCDRVDDQGAAFLSALASALDAKDETEINDFFDTFLDVSGTVYCFSLPSSLAEKAGLLR